MKKTVVVSLGLSAFLILLLVGNLFLRWRHDYLDKQNTVGYCYDSQPTLIKAFNKRSVPIIKPKERGQLMVIWREFSQLKELPQGGAVLGFVGDSLADHSGIWNVFAPGKGNINQDTADWKWVLSLRLEDNKTIKSILMFHGIYGEGWSTSSQKIYGVQPYPLVVFYQGRQLNSDYDQYLGDYYPGSYDFELYGQKESTPFAGSKVLVVFTDGTFLSADVGGRKVNAEPDPAGKFDNGGVY